MARGDTRKRIIAAFLEIAEDPKTSAKNRLTALAQLAELTKRKRKPKQSNSNKLLGLI